MRLSKVILFALACFLACASLLRAQVGDKGSISGTIQDSTPAIIPGATITIVDASGASQTATTDVKGEYAVVGLSPGTYQVTVSSTGFKDLKSAAVVVRQGQTTKLDATLDLAVISTNVDVSAEALQVQNESAQVGGTLTSEDITSLNINGGSFTQLVALAPGVSNQTGQDEALVGPKGSVNYSVNGGRVEYNSYLVDGGDILNASINGNHSSLIVYPSVDAIGDMQILTSNYGAQYGRSASGTVLTSTKSGGTSFHGDGYLAARNNIFNARNFFDRTQSAPLYQEYEPGFTIGGPLYIPGVYNTKKDKTYFFVSEMWRHDKKPQSFNVGVPSRMERNCLDAPVVNGVSTVNAFCANPFAGVGGTGPTQFGDFSDVCPAAGGAVSGSSAGNTVNFVKVSIPGSKVVAYPDCPGSPSGQTTINGVLVPQYSTVAGNLIPINSISGAILGTGLIPQGNATTGCNSTINGGIGSCFDLTVSPLTTWRDDVVRLDHNFSEKEKLTLRLIHDSWSTVEPTPEWGYLQNSFPTVQNQFTGPGINTVAHFTSTLSNISVNDASFSFSTDHITLTDIAGKIPGNPVDLSRPSALTLNSNPCIPTNYLNPCGMGYLFNNGFGGKIPGIVIAGTNSEFGGKGFAVDPAYMPWHHSNPTYSIADDLSMIFGKHTFNFGVLVIIAQRNEVNPPVGANTGDLQGIATFTNINSEFSTGNAFADFLQGAPQTYRQDSAQGVYHNNYMIAEPYVQDNWTVVRGLTVNLGLRMSLFGNYHEKYLQSYNWVPSNFSSAVANNVSVNPFFGYLTYNGSTQPLDLNNLAASSYLTNGVEQCGVGGVPASCMKNHLVNPSPRIGLAWDPFGDGKMSVRAGYGIFFEHGTGNEANTGSLEGSPGNISKGGVLDMTQYYPLSWGCIGGAGVGCPGAGAVYPLNLTSIPTKTVWPYVQQWNLSVERQLPWNLFGTIAYVGSKGTHLTAELQINQLVPVNAAQNPFGPGEPLTLDGTIGNGGDSGCAGEGALAFHIHGQTIMQGQPGFVNLEAACAGVAPGVNPNALRIPGSAIAPGMGQIFSLQNIANSAYNGLQITIRRAKGPFSFGVSYSYSHSFDTSSDRSDATLVNAYNFPGNRASSDFDQRHLLNLSYTYELPLRRFMSAVFAPGKTDPSNIGGAVIPDNPNWGAKYLNGWQLSGVTVYSTGTPFSVINGGDPANRISSLDNAGVVSGTGAGSYPDLCTPGNMYTASSQAGGIQTGGLGVIGPVLGNPAQFCAPRGLTFGNAGRNSMNNPSRLNFDVSFIKNIKTSESTSLEFRAETYNIFNHTQFNIVDNGAGNNVITCYNSPQQVVSGVAVASAGCNAGNSFLRPIDAHQPRTMQFSAKFKF